MQLQLNLKNYNLMKNKEKKKQYSHEFDKRLNKSI